MPDASNAPPSFGSVQYWTSVDSPLKQIASPNQWNGSSMLDGIGFAMGTAVPQATGGYMFAYNFTGLGSNTGDFLSKMGIASTTDSDRVLGSNFFLPMKNSDGGPMTCAETSTGGCGGKQVHTYIQGYPSKPMGALPGVVDAITHLNPGMFLDAMYDAFTDTSPRCERITLPVGSALNQCTSTTYSHASTDLGYRPDVSGPAEAANVYNACKNGCSDVAMDDADNCIRQCGQFWWTETQCVPQTKDKTTIDTNHCGRGNGAQSEVGYDIPSGGLKATGGGAKASMTYSSEAQKTRMSGIQYGRVSPPENFRTGPTSSSGLLSEARAPRRWWPVRWLGPRAWVGGVLLCLVLCLLLTLGWMAARSFQRV